MCYSRYVTEEDKGTSRPIYIVRNVYNECARGFN